MDIDIKKMGEVFGKEIAEEFSNELLPLLSQAKEDAKSFAFKFAQAIEDYTMQIANGEITKDDYERYMRHWKKLAEGEIRVQKVRMKSLLQNILDKMESIIFGKLMSLIK